MSIDNAYRRLAIAILELDIATLAAKLAHQRTADRRPRSTILPDVHFAETAAEPEQAA